MIFKTESGSTYEIDSSQNKMRRLYGNRSATSYQGSDGEWKQFLSISIPVEGENVIIFWAVEDSVARTTMTSKVVQIGGEKN